MRVLLSLVVSLVLAMGSAQASDRPSRMRTEIQFGPPILLASNETGEDTAIQTEPDRIDPIQPLTLNVSRCERECSPGMDVPKLHFGSRPIRVIGHLMAAPEDNSSGSGSSLRISPVHPDEIQFHFAALADLLSTSGLTSESNSILELQESFQRGSYQRLLLAHKESQLRTLQAEIASLKQSLNAVAQSDCIELHLIVAELNSETRQKLCEKLEVNQSRSTRWNLINQEPNNETVGSHFQVDHDNIVDLLREADSGSTGVSILSRPRIRTLDSQEAEVEIRSASATSAGKGISIRIQPTLVESGKMQLKLAMEYITAEADDSGTQNSAGLSKQRIATVAEIVRGSTLVVVGKPQIVETGTGDERCVLVVIKDVMQSDTTATTSPPAPSSTNRLPRITSRPAIGKSVVRTY